MVVAAPERRWHFISSRVTDIRGSLPRYSWGGAGPRPQQGYYHDHGTLLYVGDTSVQVQSCSKRGLYIRPTREWKGCGPVPQGSETRRVCVCLDTAPLSPPVGLRLVDVSVILVVEPVCNIQHDLTLLTLLLTTHPLWRSAPGTGPPQPRCYRWSWL